jgi:hypothetical protein
MVMSRVLAAGVLVLAAGLSSASAEEAALGRLELRPGVNLEVTELKRVPDKNLVMARFAVANGGSEAVTMEELGLRNGSDLARVSLLDFKNGKQYDIGSGYGTCLCSRVTADDAIEPGQRKAYWAMYGNPPADVAKVAVMVRGLPPAFDVPLGK